MKNTTQVENQRLTYVNWRFQSNRPQMNSSLLSLFLMATIPYSYRDIQPPLGYFFICNYFYIIYVYIWYVDYGVGIPYKFRK